MPVVAGPAYTELYADYDNYKQHYYGCITALDEQVGRLRSELRALQVADNTLVMFCSDNGPEGNDKAPGSTGGLRGRKRSLFEGGVRVPWLAEWPATIKPFRVTNVPVVTSDYLPTILDAIGTKPVSDRPIDGISLLPLFHGVIETRSKPIAFESSGQLALIDDRYKIVRPTNRGKRQKPYNKLSKLDTKSFMLFDIQDDRSESRDIAKDRHDIINKMVTTLDDWRRSCRVSLAGEDY